MGALFARWCPLAASALLACGGYPLATPTVAPVLQMPLPAAVSLVADSEHEPLGQVYDGAPRAGAHSVLDLGVRLRDNPCRMHLLFDEEPEELRVTDLWAPNDALFETLGFAPFAGISTHLFVQAESSTVRTARAGEGYAECCAVAACGDGMVTAVHDGRLEAHPAMAMHASAPPLVLIGQQGDAVGLALHEGRIQTGAVALELTAH